MILHAGGNDLQDRRSRYETPIDDVADDLIETGETCRRLGVKEVFIAGVTSRLGLKRRCFKLNDKVEGMCKSRGFKFIDNRNISTSHLYDGVHIGKPGSNILMENYLRALNSD